MQSLRACPPWKLEKHSFPCEMRKNVNNMICSHSSKFHCTSTYNRPISYHFTASALSTILIVSFKYSSVFWILHIRCIITCFSVCFVTYALISLASFFQNLQKFVGDCSKVTPTWWNYNGRLVQIVFEYRQIRIYFFKIIVEYLEEWDH